MNQDWIAQIGLVGSKFTYAFIIGNPRPFGIYRAAATEFLQQAGENRLDRIEHVLLGHEGHFQIKLVKVRR